MNNFQNQTPPPVLRNHHQHLQSANYHQQQQHHHHTTSSSSSSASVTTTLQHPTPPLSNTQFMAPHHHQHSHHHHHHHHQQQHLSMAANQSLLPVPTPPLPPLPPPPPQQQQQHQPQPLISNSLAIRQEIQRFESVHPSIYAIYDLIDLLPITDAQIAQQIRDHVVCIEGTTLVEKGWVLNSQAKKFVKNVIKQMPCGWPELGIPAVAPYINPDLELHLQKNPINSSLQFIRFKFEGLDDMIIKDLKVSYTFNKLVKFHFQFKKLKATAAVLNLHTLADALQQLGVAVEYEGSGPLEVTLENVSLKGSYKYKMPVLTGSVKIYKFNAILKLDSVAFNMGNILGNGVYNNFINDQIEKLIPELINGSPKLVSEELEKQIVPRVNAFFNGKKLWDVLAMIGQPGHKCKPTPAPWLLQN